MYKKLNITENHLQILSLFTNGFNKEYYIREVQKILKISPRTAQLILNDLEKKAILKSEIKGKIKIYKIKKGDIAKDYLSLVEQYKKIIFLEKNILIKEIITKITNHINGIGVIFGSYAKGIEKKDSDLDIFVVGDYNKNEIKKVSKLYNIEINIKNYPTKIFENDLRSDILIKEVIDNHVIFLNIEQFIKIILKNG